MAHVTQITKSFPKDFKHSLAARLREECVSLVVFIYKANAARHARGEWIESILERMQVIELLLDFHPRKVSINRIEHGVNFVGYIVKPHRKYLRRSTLQTLRRKLREPDLTHDATKLRATVNSYFGLMKHANAYGEREKLAQRVRAMGQRTDDALTKMIGASA